MSKMKNPAGSSHTESREDLTRVEPAGSTGEPSREDLPASGPAGSTLRASFEDPAASDPAGPFVHASLEDQVHGGPAGSTAVASSEDHAGSDLVGPLPEVVLADVEDESLGEPTGPFAKLLGDIRERHRMRDDLLRPEGDQTRRAKGICRRMVGGGKEESRVNGNALFKVLAKGAVAPDDFGKALSLVPIMASLAGLKSARKAVEKELIALAQLLPPIDWWCSIRGLSPLGLGMLVGETGDPTAYKSDAALWKRMGVGVMPDGKRQRRVKDAKAAVEHKYSPRRREIMHRVGDPLVKLDPNPYRDRYLREKARLAELHVDWSKAHVHFASMRIMEKKLLVHLRRAWAEAVAT